MLTSLGGEFGNHDPPPRREVSTRDALRDGDLGYRGRKRVRDGLVTTQPFDIPAHLFIGLHGEPTLLTLCKFVNLTQLKSRTNASPTKMASMKDIDPVAVGRRLAALRQTVPGMTQAALAARLGVSNGAVGLWETGSREIKYYYLGKICNLFRVTPDVLLIGDLEGVTGRRRAVIEGYLADIAGEE